MQERESQVARNVAELESEAQRYRDPVDTERVAQMKAHTEAEVERYRSRLREQFVCGLAGHKRVLKNVFDAELDEAKNSYSRK